MPQISQLADVLVSQLFWLAIVFGLIFFGIGRALLPKIRSTVDARDAKISEDLDGAKAARAAAEQTEADWRERIDQARVEAARLAEKSKRESARETEARVKDALVEIDARVEGARLRIREAVAAARLELEATAAEAAQQMVERLTGLKIDKNDAARAVAAEFELLGSPDRIKEPGNSTGLPKRLAAGR